MKLVSSCVNTTQPRRYTRILLVTSSNFPFGGAGANVLRLLTIGLVQTGRKVSVLLQRGKQFGEKPITSKTREGNIEGVSYAYCGFLTRNGNYIKKIIDSLAGIIIPALFLIRNHHQLDCVIIYNGSAYECVPILIACKILRVPIINHVVEWYAKETLLKSWYHLPKWWDFLFRMKIVNKYFNGLIVTSTFLKSYYTKRNFKSESIFILPNLVDSSTFQIKDSLKFKENKNSVRIGYCGTPTKKDGINDLFLAFKKVHKLHPNSELYIIGDTKKKSVLPKCKEISKELGIFEKVHFTGLVEWTQIPILLNSCDILVLARPSGRFAEAGFPTKLGEYMSCRKPVVVTRVGDIPFYLKDKENAMLAEPDNPDSFAFKINFLIENPETAQKIGENGYRWSKNKLGYVESTQNVGKFLEKFTKINCH